MPTTKFPYPNPFENYNRVVSEIRYPSLQDVKLRLYSSFVKYKGIPVWVYDLSPAGDGVGVYLVTADYLYEGIVSANDDNLDIESPSLGWCNTIDGPVFLERAPIREQKQGWDPHTATYHMPFNSTGPRRPPAFKFRGGRICGSDIFKMMTDDYPAIEDVVNPLLIDKDGKKVENSLALGGALSADWAISRVGVKHYVYLLMHNQFDVGYYNSKTRIFTFVNDALTKTRKKSIDKLIARNGGGYVVEEYLG